LSAAVRKAIQGSGNNSATQLCEDLKYVPQHVFGSHKDLTNDEFARRKEEILRQLASVDCDTVVNDIVGQHDNIKWHEARRNRITASTFGRICVRSPTTSCHFLSKSILNASQHLSTAPIIYGRFNEKKAIAKYEDKKGVKVLACDLEIIRVTKDEHCWNNFMLLKLKAVFNSMLPELADPSIPRRLKARDSETKVNAQKKLRQL
ncbi:hypothetical protein ILUMI_15622, partial [Ignelater luminosus]